jgi:hypothetical protein
MMNVCIRFWTKRAHLGEGPLMSSWNTQSTQWRNPLADPLVRRFLRRVAWIGVTIGAAYTAVILTWIALDPRW